MKILMVNNVPWKRELGGARLQLEVAEELRKLGHDVDHFDSVAALGPAPPGRLSRLVGNQFAKVARRFVQDNGSGYDVVDAPENCLPYTKAQLVFDGLLVMRSVGLLYSEYARFERRTWPELVPGTVVGQSLVRYEWWRAASACRRQLDAADLLNLQNHDELKAVRGMQVETPAIVLPGGISEELFQGFASAATERESSRREVAFIGAWSLRKGRADWPRIVRRIRERVPDARFAFLGTVASREVVVRELGLDADCDFVTVVPSYESSELPFLLAGATTGAFPSYADSLGFGALEMIAAGLPTVAYAASGPRETLEPLSYPALVSVGDADALADRLADILWLDPADYRRWSAEGTARANDFHWRDIARLTADAYDEALSGVRDGRR